MTCRYENEGFKAKKNPENIKNTNKEIFLASSPSPFQQL